MELCAHELRKFTCQELTRGVHWQLPAYGVGRGVGKGLSKLKISVKNFAIYNLWKIIPVVSRGYVSPNSHSVCNWLFNMHTVASTTITTYLCPPPFSQCLFHSSILSWMSCYMSGQLLKWLSCHASVWSHMVSSKTFTSVSHVSQFAKILTLHSHNILYLLWQKGRRPQRYVVVHPERLVTDS